MASLTDHVGSFFLKQIRHTRRSFIRAAIILESRYTFQFGAYIRVDRVMVQAGQMHHPTRPVPVERVTIRHRDGMGWVFMAESTDHRISPNNATRGRRIANPFPRAALRGLARRFPIPGGRRSHPSLAPTPLSTTGTHRAPATSRGVPRAQPRTRSPPCACAPRVAPQLRKRPDGKRNPSGFGHIQYCPLPFVLRCHADQTLDSHVHGSFLVRG